MTSNVVLSTIGSIQPDVEAADVELDEMHFETSMGFAGASTRTLESLREASPAPAYNSIEGGFAARPGGGSDVSHLDVLGQAGICINIEKTTSTI